VNTEHVDVVVVGAGLSGVGAAYRLQTECPDRSYAVLEAREAIGGTWDLFRYPGIRSDSDMFTLGYPFKPWRDPKAIADGPSILSYIEETAREFGIDKHIRFGTKVVAADFSTADACWTLTLQHAAGGTSQLTCSFLYSCSGYYDYERPYAPDRPGLETFAGRVVHPQFWPEDLDCTGKRVVVIGSGATAITLVPALARDAAAVTMLQRSPTWIGVLPGRDALADRLRALLPAPLAHKLIRAKNITFSTAFYQFCKRRPQHARRLLTGLTARRMGADVVAEHFTPSYNPWEQRFCVAPDADFFRAIKKGRAEVVTDTIDAFVPEGIRLASGRVLEADIVVTATGLQLLPFGGVTLSVDDAPVKLDEQFVWRGAMITGIPNFAVCVGYTNASWTLRADLSSRLVCKVLRHMRDRGYAAVVPQPSGSLRPQPLLDLRSGYVQRSIGEFPHNGNRQPWQVRQNYVLDAATTLRGSMDELVPVVRSRIASEVGA
jgi:cation diffusion facilitator CzcD-associated flavoprotein CzcO